jgi:hypothetical protein
MCNIGGYYCGCVIGLAIRSNGTRQSLANRNSLIILVLSSVGNYTELLTASCKFLTSYGARREVIPTRHDPSITQAKV